MIQRCTDPNNERYKDYGGRGISVCSRWMDSFDNFYEDMYPTWAAHKTLDRVDNMGNYEPTNCRWATDRQQRANQRESTYVSGAIPLRGVTYEKAAGKYRARIRHNKKRLNLGLFETPERANEMYQYAREKLKDGWKLDRIRKTFKDSIQSA